MRLVSTRLRLWILAGGAAAALACAAQPAAAATALSGELNIVADAMAHSGPTVTSTDHQSWSGAPATLNASAFAQASAGIYRDHNERVSSFGAAQATWASANAGQVLFTDYGWNFSVLDPASPDSEADLTQNRPGDGADWSYTFTAAGAGVFQMDYNVVGAGNTFGLQGWSVGFNGASFGGPAINMFADPTQSGVFQGFLTAGQTYTVSLFGNPNVAQSGVANFAGSMDGTFDWRITERGGVPEPAGWALMLVGFGGVGATLRSRRRALAA